ncbi:hypothetical protein [Rhizobium sp. L43]|uniref:hypothetical protein n=1 Tax=Rhizobium sp. L43 TaxID=2035452 RepID=UPI000BE8193F|nr:hypothetical protein [Rhizobium sp. L43]PDS76374.1 hypothetical protein CO667_22525 [Rhizobium sp. L43]
MPSQWRSPALTSRLQKVLLKVWEDPKDFAGALQLNRWRHGETFWTVDRGIIGPDDLADKNTLLSGIEGRGARMARQSLAERNKKQKARQRASPPIRQTFC